MDTIRITNATPVAVAVTLARYAGGAGPGLTLVTDPPGIAAEEADAEGGPWTQLVDGRIGKPFLRLTVPGGR